MTWDAEHWVYHFGNEKKEIIPSFWNTVVRSPQWKLWEKVAYSRGFDIDESQECNWLSPEHFQAFLEFCLEKDKAV